MTTVRGVPKPSALPSTPQWMGMDSGSLSHKIIPNSMGKRINTEDRISFPLFVQIVEEGWENSDVAYISAQKYLLELKEHNIDTLVLGCTHYPALRYTIGKVLGDKVTLINPAYETAKLTKNVLKERCLLNEKLDGGTYKYYVSDDPNKFKRIGGNMIRKEIEEVEKVNIEI